MLNAIPDVCGLLIVANAKWSTVVLAMTENVIGLPVPAVSAPPEPVPDAVIVTDPAVVPVTVSVATPPVARSEEHTSELQSRGHLVCRLLLEKKKKKNKIQKTRRTKIDSLRQNSPMIIEPYIH